jgi:hypothetical protein
MQFSVLIHAIIFDSWERKINMGNASTDDMANRKTDEKELQPQYKIPKLS